MRSTTYASGPISTRRAFRRTPRMIFRAAARGVVRAARSKPARAASTSSSVTSRMLASMRAARAMFVFTPPGCTHVADTGTPAMSSSSRSASVKPRTANFAAFYAAWVGMPTSPKMLETFTTCPSPDAFRYGRNAFVPWTTPQKFIPISHSKSS